MDTSNLVMGSNPTSLEMPIDSPGATDANAKKFNSDNLYLYDDDEVKEKF